MTDQNLDSGTQPNQNPQSEQDRQTPPPIPQAPVYQQTANRESAEYNAPKQEPQYRATYGYSNYNASNMGNRPDNYLVMNIVATIIGFICTLSCCVSGFIGVVGLVFSTQVNSRYEQGDINSANNNANIAKILAIVSLVMSGIIIIGWILYVVFVISLAGLGEALNKY